MIPQDAVYRARCFGDHVNTDNIIASHRKRETLDPSRLSEFLFESIAPGFSESIRPGDIVVAGENFGCGSAMEVPATSLQAAGLKIIAAKSFSRTFYRNAINNGLMPMIVNTTEICEGDDLRIDLSQGRFMEIARLNIRRPIESMPELVMQIFACGGLMNYLASASMSFVGPEK